MKQWRSYRFAKKFRPSNLVETCPSFPRELALFVLSTTAQPAFGHLTVPRLRRLQTDTIPLGLPLVRNAELRFLVLGIHQLKQLRMQSISRHEANCHCFKRLYWWCPPPQLVDSMSNGEQFKHILANSSKVGCSASKMWKQKAAGVISPIETYTQVGVQNLVWYCSFRKQHQL